MKKLTESPVIQYEAVVQVLECKCLYREQEPIKPIISASIHQMALAHKFPDLVNYFFLKVSKI